MKYTPDYGLPLWDPEDLIRRVDFNGAHEKLEAALCGLLTDTTRTLLELPPSAGTDDAFQKLFLGSKQAWAVTVKTDRGDPVVGLSVNGLTQLSGSGTAVTNQQGVALGTTTGAAATFSVTSPWIDYQNFSEKFTKDGNPLTNVTIELQRTAERTRQFTGSITFCFSPYVVDFDAAVCGGGGGGAGFNYLGTDNNNNDSGGGGGAGGHLNLVSAVAVESTHSYQVVIGGGGSGGPGGQSSSSSPGGTTTLKDTILNTILLSANGGAGATNSTGGTGNGNGGGGGISGVSPGNGSNGNGNSLIPLAGGGGAGGQYFSSTMSSIDHPSTNGGSPYGGIGYGFIYDDTGMYLTITGPNTGLTPGGGGGGGGGGAPRGASGGNGLCVIQWRYAE